MDIIMQRVNFILAHLTKKVNLSDVVSQIPRGKLYGLSQNEKKKKKYGI